jgi:ABC-type molybdate transport system substrate-binding protein
MSSDQTTLRVICAGGFRAAMEQIAPIFTQTTGVAVALTFGAPAKTRELVSAGAGFDAAVVTLGSLNEEASAQLDGSTRFIVAKSPVGMGLRAGLAPRAIDTVEGFSALIRDLPSVGLSDPKAGTNLGNDIITAATRLGFGEDLNSRVHFVDGPGSVVSAAVAKGHPDAVITLVSEIITVDGVTFTGLIPDAMGLGTPFVAAAGKQAERPAQAQQLLAFLREEPALSIMRETGLVGG